MKFNLWTLGLAAAGLVSLPSVTQAEETQHQVLTALSSTTLSGYVDTSAIWKFGTGNAFLPGRSYDGAGKQDGFNLNVVKLTLAKPLDEGQWSAGYTVDLLAGPDAAGFGTQTAGGDLAIKQAYVALRAPVGNGIDFKMGVWDTPIGYEVFDSGSNPNYSRSYGYFLEPTTYTGLSASYKFTDSISAMVGVANNSVGFQPGMGTTGAGVGINTRSASETRKSYMATVTLTAPESFGFLKGSSLYLGGIQHGSTQIPGAGKVSSQYNLYVGATLPLPITGLAVGVAYDYVGQNDTSKGANNAAYASAAAAYVTYQATEKLKLNGRVDYATADNGAAFGVGSANPKGGTDLFAATFTSDYALWANVISRIEVRWDHSLDGAKHFGGTGFAALPANRNALSVALNVIYKF